MRQYFIRRALLVIPTFFGITLMVFTVTRFVPGGPIDRILAEMQATESGSGRAGVGADSLSADQIKMLEEYYGFDKPIIQSYFSWLGKILTLDFGVSTRYGMPVWELIVSKLPVATYYGVMTTLLIYLISIPLGILKAIYHKGGFDAASSFVIFVGYAVPGYVVGLILLLFLGFQWDWFPMGGFTSYDYPDKNIFGKAVDILYHSALPLVAYVSGGFAVMTIKMKNSLMEQMASDYVRTAIAEGFTFSNAVVRQALRNSLIPIVANLGNILGLFLTGSFLIEKIFNIDGMGLLGFEAIVERDYPVVMGILTLSAILQLVGNIVSDICVAIVEPRVQFR